MWFPLAQELGRQIISLSHMVIFAFFTAALFSDRLLFKCDSNIIEADLRILGFLYRCKYTQ